jgi:hypothetical protein
VRRTLVRLVVAMCLLTGGWLAGRVSAGDGQDRGFRLTIDASGDTSLRCDGCAFLAWADGHSKPQRMVSLDCGTGAICSHVVGATLAKNEPLQIASGSTGSTPTGH